MKTKYDGRTAMRRKKLSAPMAWLVKYGYIHTGCDWALDYGCGRGFDAEALRIAGWDPVHCRNTAPLRRPWHVLTCHYVLNVLEHDRTILGVVEQIQDLLTAYGSAYVTVRADDCNLNGRTGKGTYQRVVHLGGCHMLHEVKGRWRLYLIHAADKVTVEPNPRII